MFNIQFDTKDFDQIVRNFLRPTPVTYKVKKDTVYYYLFGSNKHFMSVDGATRTLWIDPQYLTYYSNLQFGIPDNLHLGVQKEIETKVAKQLQKVFPKGKAFYVKLSSHTEMEQLLDQRVDEVVTILKKMQPILPEVLQLMQTHGFRMNIDTYNKIWRLYENIQELKEKLPISNYRIKSILNNKQENEDLFQAAKRYFMANWSLGNAEWKHLCKLSQKDYEWLFHENHSWPYISINWLIQLHMEMGKFPKVTACKAVSEWLSNDFYSRNHCVSPELRSRFMYQALVGSYRVPNVKQWSANEFYQVRDWFKEQGRKITPDKNQLKLNWNGFVKYSERYHRDIGHQNAERALRLQEEINQRIAAGEQIELTEEQKEITYSWSSAVRELKFTSLNMRVVALTSAKDLAIEGHIMHHCVGGYAAKAYKENDSRLFSIQTIEPENRVATLQITLNKKTGKWVASQCRGKYNCKIEDDIMQVAEATAAAYNEAVKKLEEEQKRQEAEHKRQEAEAAKQKAYEEKMAKQEGVKKLLLMAEVTTDEMEDVLAEQNAARIGVVRGVDPTQMAQIRQDAIAAYQEGELANAG